MPEPELVSLEIDGQKVSVPPGTLVVEAAKKLGIEIPVFCYHHKLKPVGACRLCLVEMTPGPPKPQTACTTPVAEGLCIKTNSALAVEGRADILEFELANHPLDCPVCDKGGECPLQDYTYRHGYPVSRIDAPRLHFQKPIPLSPQIALDRERCVLCYRCTRYYDEVAWEQELTVENRGVESYIASQFDQPLTSIFSGNIIDLCPVGALTSRVWRFESRPWDMNSQSSVCSKCSVGCNITLWERRGNLMRITSRENDQIDDGWICDQGRFDYTEVNDPNRLKTPLNKKGEPLSWDQAIRATVNGFKPYSGNKLGIHIPQAITNEAAFILSKLLKGPWQGARVNMEKRSTLPLISPTARISELDQVDTIVVIASDTRSEVPIINLRIKKAVSNGANLLVVHPNDLDLDRWPNIDHIRPQGGKTIRAIEDLRKHKLLKSGSSLILFGDGQGSEDPKALTNAITQLATSLKAKLMPLYRGTNERGALALDLLSEPDNLEGVEALLCWGPISTKIPDSVKFLVTWDILQRPQHGHAHLWLPEISFAQTQGTYLNVEGLLQWTKPILPFAHPLRESWEVLLAIGQALGLKDKYKGIFEIQKELSQIPAMSALSTEPRPNNSLIPVLQGPARP